MKPQPLVHLVLALLAAPLAAQSNHRASITSTGGEPSFGSANSVVSDDGRIVVFASAADDIVPGDTNFGTDVFAHDCDTNATWRISVSSGGAQGNGSSIDPVLTADGRYAFFASAAKNFVADDDNLMTDIFRHDLETGVTTRVGLGTGGVEPDWHSTEPDVSADGRYLVFLSGASNLSSLADVPTSVYLRDLQTGVTELVSVDMNGEAADNASMEPSVSDDGRFVVFSSTATDLVPNDTNGAQDLFLRDRLAGTTVRVNLTSQGEQTSAGGAQTLGGTVSNDGRYVAYWSDAGGIVPGDSNGYSDVFLRDLVTGTSTRLSVGPAGEQGNFPSRYPDLSSDGRYCAFQTWAWNIVPDDDNAYHDIILTDLWSGTTKRVSLDMAGDDPDGHSYEPALSSDGRWVVFESGASDLVPDDNAGQQDVFRYGPMPRDPFTDIDLDGLDGPVTLPFGQPATTTISCDSGDHSFENFDWWVYAEVPGGATAWMLPTLQWVVSATPIPVYQGGLVDITNAPIIAGATLPVGTYRIHFVLDAPDGVLQGTYADVVEFTVE